MHRSTRRLRWGALIATLALWAGLATTGSPAALAGGTDPTCSVDDATRTLSIELYGNSAILTRDGTVVEVAGVCDESFDSDPLADDFTSIEILGADDDEEMVEVKEGTDGSAWGWAGLYTVTVDLGDGPDDEVYLYGTLEADTIDGEAFATYSGVELVTIYGDDYEGGEDGDNTLTGVSATPNTLYGGSGDDFIYGGSLADELNGQDGDDHLFGRAGDDEIYGQPGDDLIDGGPGDDLLNGAGEDDSLYGGVGTDDLDGGSGDDLLDGGAGDDTLESRNGADHLYGRAGDDYMSGSSEEDFLYGGSGNDSLYGGTWADFLDGGAGSDDLHGGDANDTCAGYIGSPTGVRRYKGDTFDSCFGY